jgi:hypothetical protein
MGMLIEIKRYLLFWIKYWRRIWKHVPSGNKNDYNKTKADNEDTAADQMSTNS